MMSLRSSMLRMPYSLVSKRLLCQSSLLSSKAPKMPQIEVDEREVQAKLGKIQMEFVKIAERQNADRARRHTKHRKRDWVVALSCFGIVLSIYGYTIFAIKQERFLDDFDLPDPVAEGINAINKN